MTAKIHGLPWSMAMHVEKVLTSDTYRIQESDERLRYFQTPESTIENIFRHINERSLELHCHDVGTVIRLHELGHLRRDERRSLAAKMEASLDALGIRKSLLQGIRASLSA